MKKEFQVYGKIIINVEIDVEASDEESAIKEAIENLKNDYNLNVIGYQHNPETDLDFDLHAAEYEN